MSMESEEHDNSDPFDRPKYFGFTRIDENGEWRQDSAGKSTLQFTQKSNPDEIHGEYRQLADT